MKLEFLFLSGSRESKHTVSVPQLARLLRFASQATETKKPQQMLKLFSFVGEQRIEL